MNQVSNLLNSSRCFLPPIKHCILSWSSSVSRKEAGKQLLADVGLCQPCGLPSLLSPCFSSVAPSPAQQLSRLFPSSWLSDRLPTSHPLKRENPLQWKLCFALSIMASQSKTKVRCKNPDQREGLDVCPRQQCGSSFPTSVDSASSPSMAFEPSS